MKRILFLLITIVILIIVSIFLFREKNVEQNSLLPISNSTLPQIVTQTFTPLIIDSMPPGANVFLDNKELGVTPLTVTNLSQTTHQLILRKEGFEDLTATFSTTNTTNFIRLPLVPLSIANTPLPSSVQTENVNFSNSTDTTEVKTTLNELDSNDPQIPTELAGKISVPKGYRFPSNANPNDFINLEIIPQLLQQDTTTKRMPVLEKNELLAKLRFGYRYNPLNRDIEPVQLTLTSLIDFGYFEPSSLSVPVDSFVSWFNQNSIACTLRTDPKSPQKINQTILSQQSTTIQLKVKGIYIFFCQGNPGPIQTISVS